MDDSENRNKRDLPEVVADILITLDKVQRDVRGLQQGMDGLRQEMNNGFSRMENSFDRMTDAVIDAMNRQTARYDTVQTTQGTQDTEVRELRQRLENLEKIVYKKAG
ncbi:hypothetical protein CDA63_17830 [Hymenobacter amundsenii]|uniref:Uncharacterized protein n=1 Tax=Hymenobacter amundsenii TaxID=2006685 RepID=A0A246FGR7_9BACT|nr:hypothetical protein [Hymenobacter amundsenii]OWP61722.1 hypothetical protein CDA63_17830 [Hymenobacter amundsenii]